jgi:hypothetical protein
MSISAAPAKGSDHESLPDSRQDYVAPRVCCLDERSIDRAIALVRDNWDRLSANEPIFVPAADDLIRALGATINFRLYAASAKGETTHLACFFIAARERHYSLAFWKIASLHVRTARLFGSGIVGADDAAVSRHILRDILSCESVDLVQLDGPRADSALAAAVRSLGRKYPRFTGRHNTARRTIRLPATFEAYLAALPSSTRKAVTRDLRIFERSKPTYRVFAAPHETEEFIRLASGLSAKTYQMAIGFGLDSTASTIESLNRLAGNNRFRGYVAFLDGEPCAFAWGEFASQSFYFRMTGYDPRYARQNAGKAIMFYLIRDLIENRLTILFDFGVLDMDYKRRFATASIDCTNLIVGKWWPVRSFAAVALDHFVELVKRTASRGLGKESLRKLRRLLRGT